MKRIFSALLLAFKLAFTVGTTAPVAASTAYVMKAKNRQDTTLSYDEIVSKGYSPCQRCNPSRDAIYEETDADSIFLKRTIEQEKILR